jgi:hypothetical protein
MLLKAADKVIEYMNIPDMETGFYGNPPNLWIWWKQSMVFFGVLWTMKIIVLICLAIFPFLEDFAKFLLTPVLGHPKMELVVVMLIFPLVMNIFQFWVVDQVIKGSAFKKGANQMILEDEEDDPFYDEEEGASHGHSYGPIVRTEVPHSSQSHHPSNPERTATDSSITPLSPLGKV